MRSRDVQLDKLRKQNQKLQEEIKLASLYNYSNNDSSCAMIIRLLRAERDEVITTNNKMAVDMERLLTHSEVTLLPDQSLHSA